MIFFLFLLLCAVQRYLLMLATAGDRNIQLKLEVHVLNSFLPFLNPVKWNQKQMCVYRVLVYTCVKTHIFIWFFVVSLLLSCFISVLFFSHCIHQLQFSFFKIIASAFCNGIFFFLPGEHKHLLSDAECNEWTKRRIYVEAYTYGHTIDGEHDATVAFKQWSMVWCKYFFFPFSSSGSNGGWKTNIMHERKECSNTLSTLC